MFGVLTSGLRARVLRASFAEGLQGGVSMKALRALCLDLSRCAHRALSFQAGYVLDVADRRPF